MSGLCGDVQWVVWRWAAMVLLAWVFVLPATTARGDYQDIVDYFEALYGDPDAAVFPVQNQSLASIESAFGPRIQTSVNQDDFHRGIDIDGNLNADPVVATLDGYFYDYRTYTSGGHVVILEHRFSDFLGGGTNSINYQGQNMTRFYTWYMHLYDDGIDNNATSTDDIVRVWKDQLDNNSIKTPISAGTQIGVLGNSGEPAPNVIYGPHVHFELRVGSNSSLEYQLDNLGSTTQWGFDPHMNPMLLFEPYVYNSNGAQGYTQLLVHAGQGLAGAVVDYTSTNDDMPLLNRWEITITDDATDQVVEMHILDYNQRTGYDATTNANLDTWDKTSPYIDPVAFGDSATQFDTQLIVPFEWMQAYADGGYTVNVTATDIWGNSETVSFIAIPEPASVMLIMAGATMLTFRRRR